jgi:site-specific DNA recombinase
MRGIISPGGLTMTVSGRRRRVWASKVDLLAGGLDVLALRYQRASADKRHTGKSVEDQAATNLKEIRARGWRDFHRSFTDNMAPASKHAPKKEREDFELLLETIESGVGDVLVMWALNRTNRDLGVYVAIREMCLRVGLYFWLIDGALYDLRDKNDRLTLGNQAVYGEYQVDALVDDTLRGLEGAAARGMPHGRSAYGYRRIYDKSRAFEAEVFDTDELTAIGVDGAESTYTRAGIVREIYTRIAAAVPLVRLVEDFQARGIPSPSGNPVWATRTIRDIAKNPYYIGKRHRKGEVIEAAWDPLIDPELYWSVVAILRDPARLASRPGKGRYLLSYLMECGGCAGAVQGKVAPLIYRCHDKACVSVPMEVLDKYVEAVLVEWLSRDDVYDLLTKASPTTDREVAEARAEVEEIGLALREWEEAAMSFESGIRPADYIRITSGLRAQKERAEIRAAQAPIPPVLRDIIGPKAAQNWSDLAGNVAVKRQVIKLLTNITLLPLPDVRGVARQDVYASVSPSEWVRFGGIIGGTVDPK